MEPPETHKAKSALSQGFFLVAWIIFAIAAVFAPAGAIAGGLDVAAAVSAGRGVYIASAHRSRFGRIGLATIVVIASLLIVGAVHMLLATSR
jgi:hypothetical protein